VARRLIAVGRALLLVFAVASVAVSLWLRVVHRGLYYPGWEVIGAAQGLYDVTTKTWGQILASLRGPADVWNTFGIPSALLPGWLASHWPSEWWPHRVTLALTLASLALVARAFDAWTVVLLAWGASGVLLTWSVTGFAYISAVLPFALAFWVVQRWRERPLATLALAALALESAWHVQELGRTVFVVFLAAGLLIRGVPRSTRAVWLLAGGWQLWTAFHHQTFNTTNYTAMHVPTTLDGLAEAVSRLDLLRQHVWYMHVDIPVLVLAGTLAALLAPRDRWFWLVAVGVQLGLVVLLAINNGMLQGPVYVFPRRVILLDFVSLAAVAAFTVAARPWARTAMIALLLAGNLWQLHDVVRWSRLPLPPPGAEQGYTLPFTENPLDYYVPFFPVDWYRELRDRADAGQKLLLLYNLTSYDENNTNPTGVLERLYLHLGPERFAASVLVFGSDRVRWNEFPMRPLADVPAALDAIEDPREFSGHLLIHPYDASDWAWTTRHREEVATTLRAIAARFRIEWAAPQKDAGGRTLLRFTIHRE
jgi:hypothetical protein